MKPGLLRALLVLTAFVLLGVLSATGHCVNRMGRAPDPPPAAGAAETPASPPPATTTGSTARWSSPPRNIFLNQFRLYLAWALVTPGILYLARRFPLIGPGRVRALAVHLIVPLAGSLPFFFFRLLINRVFGFRLPAWDQLASVPWGLWGVIFMMQAITAAPVYWLIVGLGTVLQVSRGRAANELREIELRRSLAAAELDALKMKLQPHFLYNTLNALGSLARAGETDAITRMVERLGTLLRLSMEVSARQFVTLEEEVALADAYLAIEKTRFNQLQVVWRIDQEVRRALVPSLILQPLVENAFVHGLSQRLDAGLLEVAARRDGTVLRLAIRDDGPGLPPGWSVRKSAGAGLKTVGDRMRGLFPGTSGLAVENGPCGGTVVLLSMPYADAETTAIAGSFIHG